MIARKMKSGSGNRDLKIVDLGERFRNTSSGGGRRCLTTTTGTATPTTTSTRLDPHVWLGIGHADQAWSRASATS